MKTARIVLLVLAFLAMASFALADIIISTEAGGSWSNSSTWIGGVIPGNNDDVVIAGPVLVPGLAYCNSLKVNPPGSVSGAAVAPPRTLVVVGNIHNDGTIDNGPFTLDLEIGGNLHNTGSWTNNLTTITGADDRQISHEPGAGFTTNLTFGNVAAGDLIVASALELFGDADMTDGRMVLQPDCPFTLDSGFFKGDLLANGNEMRFLSWSYLVQCTLDDVIIVGEAEASFDVTVTTRLTVMDRLQNGGIGGGGGVTVEGDLINYGLIRHDNYGFMLRVHGDVQNFGSITNPTLELMGVGAVHHMSMGPEAIIDTNIFLPEFQAATIVADTPLRLASGLGLGVGTLILEPGSSLQFTDFGGLGSGIVEANGNEISITGSGSLSTTTIDRGVIVDQVAMHHDCHFTNGLMVIGTITSWPWAAADITVEGLLVNEGLVEDGDHPLRIVALGDVANFGSFTNSRITMHGAFDQAIGVGPGIAVDEFVMESGLQASNYQWFKDGVFLPGENGQSLSFSSLGPAEYGDYYCEGDGEISRSIHIAETLGTSGIPGLAGLVELEQNYPNPFNPVTEIAFSLQRDSEVSLVVYDVAGHEVQRLVEGQMAAGRHRFSWQPQDLASGTYFYSLKAEGRTMVKKCVLLK